MSGSGPPGHDPDNPLPEQSFRWRRLLTFGLCLAFIVLLWAALHLLPASDVLRFAQGVMLLMALICLLYYGGASADEITRLVAAFRLRFGRSPEPPRDDGELPPSERIR